MSFAITLCSLLDKAVGIFTVCILLYIVLECSIDFTTEYSKLLEKGTSEYQVATRGSTYYCTDDDARAPCSGRITQVWVVYKPSTSSDPYEIANMFITVRNITQTENGLDTAQVGLPMPLPRPQGVQGSANLAVSHVMIDIPLAQQIRIEAGQTIGMFINTSIAVSTGEGFPWLIGDVGDCFELSGPLGNKRRTESLLPGMQFTITIGIQCGVRACISASVCMCARACVYVIPSIPSSLIKSLDVVGQANQNPTSPTTSSNNTSSPSSPSFISS